MARRDKGKTESWQVWQANEPLRIKPPNLYILPKRNQTSKRFLLPTYVTAAESRDDPTSWKGGPGGGLIKAISAAERGLAGPMETGAGLGGGRGFA